MEGKALENFEEIVGMIKSEQKKGKRELKVKVWQCEYFNGKMSFKNVYYKSGMTAGGEGVKELQKLGYKIGFSSTKKMVSGEKVRDLKTTNLIVRW